MIRLPLAVLFVVLVSSILYAAQPPNEELAIKASVEVQESPPQIHITWKQVISGVKAPFNLYRRLDTSDAWGTPIATLPEDASSYTDTSGIQVGTRYEYKVKSGISYTYFVAGINLPAIEKRGTVLLLIDETMSAGLKDEVYRLTLDLVGDGWKVVCHDVSRDTSKGRPSGDDPSAIVRIKKLIQSEYQSNPDDVKAVFLLGRIPQPYSGNHAFDTHVEHTGAWPTDAYYADIDGAWTDSSVDVDGNWMEGRNQNHPGDYRWDQNTVPSELELQVGRVDLWGFEESKWTGPQPKSELELLRQYLNKDHNFRHNKLHVERRGIISDSYGRPGHCSTLTGWMGYSAIFGKDQVRGYERPTDEKWINELKTESYLCGTAVGYGWPYGVTDVGIKWKPDGTSGTARFIQWDPKVVFLFMSGSWFSDYDYEGNFLRSPLASKSYCLTNAWSGTPMYAIHHMALGETIGYSARLSQSDDNSEERGYNVWRVFYKQGISSSLLGDPTLRLHPVTPPAEVTATKTGPDKVTVDWGISTDSVVGYRVYRSASKLGPYERISPEFVKGTSFEDASVPDGSHHYMVRALKLETSGSGTYYNPSQGSFSQAVTFP